MNVGSTACPQCGTIANPGDKYCNTCGTPLARPPGSAQQPSSGSGGAYAAGAPKPQAGYGPPPGPPYAPAPAPYAAPRGARCQMGHDIPPGASYCPQGHPIALDAMKFANEPTANQYGGGGQPPPHPVQGPFGPPQPMPAQGFGFGPAPPQPMPPQGGYPPPGYGGAPPGYGQPPGPGYAPPGAFGPPGAMPPQHAPYPGPPMAPPPAPHYAPPPGHAGYGGDTSPERMPAGAKMLRGFLVSFQSNAQGEFWPVFTGRATVGRANAGDPADVPLADATISSRHAAILADANGVYVEDTASTNGTYVNEEHIGMNGKRELRDGDRLRFGGYTTIVKILGRLG